MTEPEIARRCHACGASIRDLAAFCPQCGKELKTTSELTKSNPDQDKPSTSIATAPLNEAPKQKEYLDAERSADEPGKIPKLEDPKTKEPPPVPPQGPTSRNPSGRAKGTSGAPVSAGAHGTVQRATSLARNVGGDVVQRGQKLREISSVVLDEAGYDPSLRFVLVAAALFVLFLVIVLLNRFIV